MSTEEQRVARATAPRLARALGGHETVVLVAPPEYLPRASVRAALDHLRVQHTEIDLSDAAGAAPVPPDVPWIVVTGVPTDALSSAVEALQDQGFGTGLRRWVVIVEKDGIPDAVEADASDLLLDHRTLTLDPADIARLLPEATPASLRRALTDTGGVPALVAARMADGGRALGDPLPAAAAAWAARAVDAVSEDPLLVLLAWAGSMPDHALAPVALRVLGRRIRSEDVRRAQTASVVSIVGHPAPAVPAALASALRSLLLDRSPRRRRTTRQGLIAAATTVGLPALVGVRLLTTLEDWAGLDHLLARSLHLLVHLTREQRDDFFERWPDGVALQLPHLSAARTFVDPDRLPESRPGMLSSWVELSALYAAEVDEPDSLAGDVRRRLTSTIVPGRTWSHGAATRFGAEVATWLAMRCQRLEAVGVPDHADDAAALVSLCMAAAEASVRAGELATAQSLVLRASSLLHALGAHARSFPAMSGNVLAHAAFTSGKAGMTTTARHRLREYDAALAAGQPDENVTAVADLARRHVELGLGLVGESHALHYVDPERDFAPEEAAVQLLRVLLLHGPAPAIEWGQAMIQRTGWSESPGWAWWSVHYPLALLLARMGQPGRADQWRTRVPLPTPVDTAVRAAIQSASGRSTQALQLADELLGYASLTSRWRTLAVGIKLEALLAQGRETECVPLLATENWDAHVPSIALFPDRARGLVTPRLASDAVRSLRGIAANAEAVSVPDVRLTPRQVDILRRLESGDTMAAIAEHLYLRTETVRSTAKEIYRRLGVHDRESAVQMGRLSGLL